MLAHLFGFSQRIKKDKIAIYYKTNHHSLSKEQKNNINDFIHYYKDAKINKIVIIGSADFIGDHNYNLTLSRKRADKVAHFIKKNNATKVQIKFLGEQNNPYNYTPEEGIRFHRKTTIVCEYILPKTSNNIPSFIQAKKRNYLDKLPTLAVNKTLRLKNINFLYGKTKMTHHSKSELANLFKVMKKNSTLKITLEGHVCCNRSKFKEYDHSLFEKNTLSTKRAKKIYDYLLSKGIDSSRVSYKGYEFAKPMYYPEKNERHRSLNRRVEVKVIAN